jgi:plastocyanin
MSQQPRRTDPLVGELRLRVPLPILIPVAAVALIALLSVGFSRVLLSLPKEGATVVAVVTAANVMGACAVIALRRDISKNTLVELAIVVIYPVIIGVVLAQMNIGEGEAAAETESSASQTAVAEGTIAAENSQFNTDKLEIAISGGRATIEFENLDSIQHNVALYESVGEADAQENAVFTGDFITGTSTTYEFDPPPKGEYVFQCDAHPTMRGTATVQ